MECGSRLEIESSGTHLSCWAQMHCSPHTAWLIATVKLEHTHTNVRMHTCTDKRESHALPLSLSPWCGPVMSADPHQSWQLFAGWCHREEARGHGKEDGACPPCAAASVPHLHRGDSSIPGVNTHSNLAPGAQSAHVGGRGFISSFEALNHRLNCRQHLADRRDEIAGFPSLFAPTISCSELDYSLWSLKMSQGLE